MSMPYTSNLNLTFSVIRKSKPDIRFIYYKNSCECNLSRVLEMHPRDTRSFNLDSLSYTKIEKFIFNKKM
jgi:hypothetical protein